MLLTFSAADVAGCKDIVQRFYSQFAVSNISVDDARLCH